MFYKNSGIEQLVNFSLNGSNSTIFAYGQTGSGKTYTITGSDDDIIGGYVQPLELEGVLQRSLRYLYDQSVTSSLRIRASYCEIYNEMVYDLLNLENKKLQIRYNEFHGFYVNGLTVIQCDCLEEIMEVVSEGRRNRTVGSHELNKESSRSHSLLTVYLEKMLDEEEILSQGKLTFIDLAGSERLNESNSEGIMKKETGSINKSLFTLGKVITALSQPNSNNNSHIPYRDSTLTKLLMDSIGGTAYTVMITCINPCDKYYDESLSTLNYGSRASQIINHPTIKMMDKRDELILKLENEIERLKNELNNRMSFPMNNNNFGGGVGGGFNNGMVSSTYKPTTADIRRNEELMNEVNRLRQENDQLRSESIALHDRCEQLTNENNELYFRLEELERLFGNSMPTSTLPNNNYGMIQSFK